MGKIIEIIPNQKFPKLYNNAVLILFVEDYTNNYRFMGRNKVFTVTEKNGMVGFPAGGKKPMDKTNWQVMKREWREETGESLPRLTHVRRFVYNNHTAIYVARTSDRVQKGPPDKRKSDGEIIDRHFTKLQNMIRAAKSPYTSNFRLRSSVRKSLLVLQPFLT